MFCDVTRLVLGVLGNAMLTWAGVVGGGRHGWWRGVGVERGAVVSAERAAEGSVEECSGVAGGRTL